MASGYDGYVSHYLNRRISRPIARALSHTPATPNQVSLLSLVIAAGAFTAFMMGYPIVGGLLAQTCSFVDGVDGDLARLTGQSSPIGAFLDAVIDRYSDGFILLGLTAWTVDVTGDAWVWIAGFAALVGTFSVTYTRARIDESRRSMFDQGLASFASRDVRLLLIMIGAIAGLGLATIITIAALTNAVVLLRLVKARASLQARDS